MKLSEEQIKHLVRDIKTKMVSGDINSDIAIVIRKDGIEDKLEGIDGSSLQMGTRFEDKTGDEIEVLRVINHQMTLALNEATQNRSIELRSNLDRRFYLSFDEGGKIKHGLVKLEATGVSVLPRYQEKLGRDFIKHTDILLLKPTINGGSPAAGIVKGMVKIHQDQPEKPVQELYHLAAKQIAAKMIKVDEPTHRLDRGMNRHA
tara:strand:+ start:12768 stop:13379 length:612 start_codon:yes stop_codon:yes gene_type:complete